MSTPRASSQSVTSVVLRYGFAVVAVALALGCALFAHSQALRNVEFPPFLLAASATVWYAGTGPGVLAVVLSTLSFDYFFLPPLYTLSIHPPDRPLFAVFVVFVAMIAWFSARRRRIERELRHARDELATEVAERTRQASRLRTLNDDLAKRTAELQATNKELEAFAYSISHDLRAPLRHAVGYTELLQKNVASSLSDKNRRYMTLILESAKRMGTLIDDLLGFSRIGRAEARKTVVSLDGLAKEVLHDLRPEIEGRNIAWTVAALPEVFGDRSMLRVALVNLLSNAVKFTRTRTQAEIEIGRADGAEDETVVFVRDNGVGFDMKYADKLFGVFQRLHPTEAFEGTGIGLATVQRVIHRHGGRVWAEGVAGSGATFYFSIPRSREPGS